MLCWRMREVRFCHFTDVIRTWCERVWHCTSLPPEQASVIGKGLKLTDPDEGLLRRAYKKGNSSQILDQITNRSRAPAAAFEPRKIDEALSVNVESSLLEARLPLTWSADPNRQYVARITVVDCFKQNL